MLKKLRRVEKISAKGNFNSAVGYYLTVYSIKQDILQNKHYC